MRELWGGALGEVPGGPMLGKLLRAFTPLVQRLLVLLLVFLTASFFYATVSKALEVYSLKREANRLQQEIQAAQARHEQLLRQRDFLQTEAYIETIAREELGLIKPGETALGILPATGASPSRRPTPEPSPPAPRPPSWERWWELFFGEQE